MILNIMEDLIPLIFSFIPLWSLLYTTRNSKKYIKSLGNEYFYTLLFYWKKSNTIPISEYQPETDDGIDYFELMLDIKTIVADYPHPLFGIVDNIICRNEDFVPEYKNKIVELYTDDNELIKELPNLKILITNGDKIDIGNKVLEKIIIRQSIKDIKFKNVKEVWFEKYAREMIDLSETNIESINMYDRINALLPQTIKHLCGDVNHLDIPRHIETMTMYNYDFDVSKYTNIKNLSVIYTKHLLNWDLEFLNIINNECNIEDILKYKNLKTLMLNNSNIIHNVDSIVQFKKLKMLHINIDISHLELDIEHLGLYKLSHVPITKKVKKLSVFEQNCEYDMKKIFAKYPNLEEFSVTCKKWKDVILPFQFCDMYSTE